MDDQIARLLEEIRDIARRQLENQQEVMRHQAEWGRLYRGAARRQAIAFTVVAVLLVILLPVLAVLVRRVL